MGHLLPFQPLSADYPNHLITAEPEQRRLPPTGWLLLLLVVLCLAPRAASALRVPNICIDGPIYVSSARALEAGNLRAALFDGAVNVYPLILASLHHLGLEWETAAACWGVTISSLVVLPLWGWVRRQFDDRVAFVACLLYITHPKFIVESPEVMRDPTFWFFFTLAMYCMWRAVTEVRYGYFIATGAAITLASLTRVEGLFLLIPLAMWTFWRWLALRTGRRKLLVGATLCVLAFPTLLMLIDVIWLYDHDHLDFTTILRLLRLSPLTRVQPWLESLLGLEPTTVVGETPKVPKHLGLMLWKFFPTMTRGLAPLFALLMFGGMWGWRRTWARRDNQALFCTAMVILCGIWVQLWADNFSRRYALPIVLLGVSFAALGLLWLASELQRMSGWLGWRDRSGRAVAVVAMLAVLASGVVHALHTTDEPRRMAAAVGRWTRQEFPGSATLVGPAVMAEIVRYYAEGCRYVTIPGEASDTSIDELVAQNKADVVILWPSTRLSSEQYASIAEHLKRAGLKSVAADILPDASDHLFVLVRANRLESARTVTHTR